MKDDSRDITARQQAETALRESEQRLILALEAGRGGMWEWWIDTNKVVWSPGLEVIHGLRPGTFGGTLDAFWTDIHPDDRNRVESSIASVIERGEDHSLEYRIIWPDGSLRWVEGRGKLIRDDTGAPLRMLGICIDITDRRIAEEAIRESEERFRLMADNAPVMIRVTEVDGNCIYLNKGWYEFTGQGSEKGLRFGWLDAVHPADRERAESAFPAARKKREALELEYRLRRADGEYRWVIDSSVPRVRPGGEYQGYVGSVIDITDRKQLETALREHRVRAVLETSPQAILAVGRDGRIQLMNRTAERMFDYRRQELLGQPVEFLLPGGLHRLHNEHRGDFFSQPQTRLMGHGLDLFGCRRDGTTFPMEISLSDIELGDNLVTVTFISDITERKQAEESLRESEERFRTAAQCGSDHIYEWDLESDALQWWGDVESSLGYRLDTLKEFEECLHPDDHDKVMEAARRHLEKGEVYDEQYRIRAKDGTYRYWRDQGMVRSKVQGKPRKWIGACSDITDQRRMEETIRRNRNELRQLTMRLTAKHEEDYRHLARELHDVFSQRLTMLGLHVSDLEQKLSAAGVADEESLGQLGAEISQLAVQIHSISRRLHPAILDDLGLAAALENECLAFARENGIEVTCDAKGQCGGIPGDIALCLYRVTQASLNNIRQHAQAARVEVRLACTREQILFSIEDFGKGFDPIGVRGQGGLGLISIEERVRDVDGELTIESAAGKGTRIVVRIPLKKSRSKGAGQ